jgi:hypothetical protein
MARPKPLHDALRRAVDLALEGDWRAAHVIAQEHEGDEIANWIHAVVHRMEGDESNARYWYGRCRRSLRPELSSHDELIELKATLQAEAAPSA